MLDKFIFLLLCGFLVVFGSVADPIGKPSLRGVTILNDPFMSNYNGTYFGFLIELMNKISEKVGFEYQLYDSPDGQYGRSDQNGTFNGMVGEVNQTKADFALADLVITNYRKRVIDYTLPYMIDPLAMLINPEYSACLATFEDLITYNSQQENQSAQISVGLKSSGATFIALSNTADSIGKSLFDFASRNESNFVRSYREGWSRANVARFGMIMPFSFAEYIEKRYCNLTIVRDNRNLDKYEYGIALQKGSKWLEPFNRAIQDLANDGTIARLVRNFWGVDYCGKKRCATDVIDK